MILYHGSYCRIEKPDLSFSRDKLDFGKGFYLTPIKEQAERWCARYSKVGKSAVINVYELPDELPDSPMWRIKHFTAYNEEWLDYIFDCRKGSDAYKQYDIVTGGVANDRIFATLDAYFAGYMSKEMALEKLKFEHPNHQVCLLNQSLIDKHLHFTESITL